MSEKNISSGAEKAESLENKAMTDAASDDGYKLTEAAKEQKGGTYASTNAKSGGKPRGRGAVKTSGESTASTADELAEERKQARIARAEAAKAKREAKYNAKLAKHESEERERAERKAERHKNDKNGRTPGFGGWLAAVIALGVTTLALGTMLTFGWLNMNGMQADMAADTTHSLYELNSIVDNLDANLAKARISSSAADRAEIFADIAIESELAESAIEHLPVAGDLTRSMTAFINKVGESARGMLTTVAAGNDLSTSQRASIEYMYGCNRQLKEFLNGIAADCTNKDVLDALAGKGMMFEGFEGYVDPAADVPKEIYDGPFAENTQKTGAKDIKDLEEVSAERAEEICRQLFEDYGIAEVGCSGEAEAAQLTVYNVKMRSEDGDEYFAQISKSGGKLVMFDSFKECTEHNVTGENCRAIAQNFLKSAGYGSLVCVWESESGTTCDLNFVYEQNGAAVYPDMIKVKVCEERGIVTGVEALPYVLNHTERSIARPALSMSEAEAKLGGMLEVRTSRLAVIPKDGGEALAYEFCGTYGGRTYYVYLDANTGTELNVFTVVGSQLM